ncbi:MAG: cytochrome o ubiquinol oxidase [Saprospiraceae bacterium]|nr:MAG: cytochrome o ubiquinol oxidase [Saprospiraceae bacterium]
MSELFDLLLKADESIGQIVQQYGTLTYLILAAIIFTETGFVVIMFFPCDGILFSAGMMAATGKLELSLLLLLLSIATILGHTSNYFIGYFLGTRYFRKSKLRKTMYLQKALDLYKKYGTLAVFFSRYIPFMRSFVPFVSGVSFMPFWRFTLANVLGGVVWVSSYLLAGYFFGNIPIVKKNFSLIFSLLLIFLILATLIGFAKSMLNKDEIILQENGQKKEENLVAKEESGESSH